MRRALALVALMTALVAASGAFASDAATLTDQARGKYEARDFKAAAGLYEKALRLGRADAALYYDLGNAYFKSGQKARALLAWRRSEQLNPRDPDLKWNIAVLQSVLPDRIEAREGNIFIVKTRQWLGAVSADEVAWVMLAVLALFALSSLLRLAVGGSRAGLRAARPLIYTLLVLTALVSALKWFQIKDTRVVITEKEVEARYGPSERETRAFTLHEGAEGRVTDQTQDWFFITLENKNSGWVPKSGCEAV